MLCKVLFLLSQELDFEQAMINRVDEQNSTLFESEKFRENLSNPFDHTHMAPFSKEMLN